MIFDKLEKRESTSAGDFGFDWTSWFSSENNNDLALTDNSYFTGLNILSNTVAKLPISIKQVTDDGEMEAKTHYLWDTLKIRPNANMNSFDCIKSLILQYKHNGMSGLFIDRDYKGKVKALYPCRIDQFTIDNIGLIKSTKQNKVLINFTCCGVQGSCFDSEMIILRDNSLDGIRSKATKKYMNTTINTNLEATNYQADLFSNGLTNKAVVQLTSDIKDEKELKKAQEKFQRLYSSKGRVFTVPAGFNIQPLNLSLVDSQFAELKLIGKKDISSAIGIPFGLFEKGSLTEEENIAYLTNTISPILTALEQEMDWKLLSASERKQGFKIRFNVSAMLKTSPEKQSVILDRYVRDGIYTINDAKDILGLKRVDGGDLVTLPSGQITLEALKNGEASWQKGTKVVYKGGDNNNGK